MKISEVIKSLSASNAAIKNTASSEPKEGWYPAYSASGQDVWLPDCRFTQKGIVVSAVGARCGKAFKADGKWNICANTHPLSVDETKALRDYCWYMINNEDWWIKGGTAQPFVKVKDSFNRDFIFPPISEQKMIVSRLDTIQALINQKQLQIKRLDELVKARFVEMFKGKYDSFKVDEKLKTTSGGTPKSSVSEYYDGGDIPWLTSGEVNYGGITKPSNYITEKGLNNSSAKWVPENSIVIAMYGATAGKVGIVRYKTTTNQAVCSVLPNDNFNQEFLRYAFQDISEELTSKAIGGGQPNISQTIIKNSYIVDAPIEEQERFASFVKQVDKSKFAVQKSLEKTQLLFDSLMQEYFD